MSPSISKLQSHYKEKLYFLPFSSQDSITLITRSLLHELRTFKKWRAFSQLNMINWDFENFVLWELQKSAC